MWYSEYVSKDVFVTPEINLLPDNDLETRPGGKFLKWALSWGKKIVILTELVVVMAFLSRFWLDSEVANLSEEIDRRKTIILASSEFETAFRSSQTIIEKIKKITSIPSLVLIYDDVKGLISSQIRITQITIDGRKVSLRGNGEDRLLTSLVSSFKGSTDFEDVSLEKISKESSSPTVDFALTAFYNKKQ